MGNKNPNSGWVADDEKIQNSYSSSRSADIESLMSCVLFYVWVLFVCLQVSVFVVCSSMEWRESGFFFAWWMLFMGNVNHISRCWLVLWFRESKRMVLKGSYKEKEEVECHSHNEEEN
jgi:hypothetical protein